jgi:exodeoxyribonuclease-3
MTAAPLTVTTWNVNGIRAREHEVLMWIDRHAPSVLALQEVKASPEQVPAALSLETHWCYWHGHKGYSGVALLFSRAAFPEAPIFGHPDFDHETRIVTARFGSTVFASVYVPNGGKDFPAKTRFLDSLTAYARDLERAGDSLILMGDLNVAREERDVHLSLRNDKQIGQTAEERGQLEAIIGSGLIDLSRQFHPDDDALYSWWAPWRNMRDRNIGWRLDYVLPSRPLAERATSCTVFPDFGTSDHAPVHAVFEVPPPRGTGGSTPSASPTTPPREGQLKLF